MNYWAYKEELKQKAREHTSKMYAQYGDEIQEAVHNSKIYDDSIVKEESCNWHDLGPVPNVSFMKKTTVDALFAQPASAHVCVLNFASYKNPGGKFMHGSSAQEESLCHASYLYNVLSHMAGYYQWNMMNKNGGLYLNRAIYSPDIRFFKGNRTRKADVLTCAAPNKSLLKYGHFTEEDNEAVLSMRIHFLFEILNGMKNPPQKLILGAFGCGIFKQNPVCVGQYFAECCRIATPEIDEVIFAIPDDKMTEFREAFLEVKD